MKGKHEDFTVKDSGLCIHPQYPHLGANPDAIISCQCCGVGVLEIKCLYCRRDEVFTNQDSVTKKFCLQVTENGDPGNMHIISKFKLRIYVCNKDFLSLSCGGNKLRHPY